MSQKRQSRATKIVLASLLAASLSVPTFAGVVSASPVNENPVVTVAEGTTAVTFSTYKPGTTELQPAISNHLATEGILVEKDGKFEAQLTVLEKSASMIAGLQTKQGEEFVDAKEVKNEDGTITYHFPLEVGQVLESKIHVVVPAANMDKWYDFDLKAENVEEVVAETVGVTVYKDGTTEESMMKNYMSSTVEVTKEDGKNIAVITFKEANTIQSFKVEGKEASVVSEDEEANERTYSFEVSDLKKLVDVDIHVVVDVSGIQYDSKHKVQLGFDVEGAMKPNPFTDIDKDENKEAILNLYAKGIVKGQDKFNPRNDITRSQFALMVARALDIKDAPDAGFKDLGKITDQERLNAINALAAIGVVQKVDNFNPDKTLTRQQGALMLYRAVNYVAGQEINIGDSNLPFYADGAKVTDPEAQKAFALLYAGGIMTGSPTADGGKLINANNNMKRTHMAKILNGSLQYMDQN